MPTFRVCGIYNTTSKIKIGDMVKVIDELESFWITVKSKVKNEITGTFDNDKLQMDLQDYFTCSANLAGIPAISVPCGFSKNKLPIGFQFLAPHFAEDVMFKVAHAYEQKTPWHTMHPDQFVD